MSDDTHDTTDRKKPPAFPKEIGAQPDGFALFIHACMGLNACAGTDRFGKDGPPGGDGPNKCAGQGYCATTPLHNCHTQNSCQRQGGCGLYGTADQMEHPAQNECRSQGSCAVPMNAERFSANGSNQGLSVWRLARQRFKENWSNYRKELCAYQENNDIDKSLVLPVDITTAEVPAPFTEHGPTYAWLTADDDQAGFVACGSSGTSGGGNGCT